MPKPHHDEGQKICNGCKGAPQPLSNFDRRKSEAFGKRYTYVSVCKACRKVQREQKKASELPAEFYSPI
jgi:hypothetical protein